MPKRKQAEAELTDSEVEEIAGPAVTATSNAEGDTHKKARFEKKHKVSECTDAEVLGTYLVHFTTLTCCLFYVQMLSRPPGAR